MNEDADFSAGIRAKFPEGLTGIFAVGGTRTNYILEHNRQQLDPGNISTLSDYADDILDKYFSIIDMFFCLGGQNIVITMLGYQSFRERGEHYSEFISSSSLILINGKSIQFYRDHDIDPYFVGIDTLLQLPTTSSAYELGMKLSAFHQSWQYKAERHKLIWEVAAIPLFSFWTAQSNMSAQEKKQIDDALSTAPNMETMYELLYKTYSSAAYGTDLPVPHFYLGTNRNGDIKLRSLIPISLLCGGNFRLFFTPYPSLFITKDTLRTILEDLAFPNTSLRSFKTDYKDQYSSEMVEAEYQRVMQLRNDPNSTIGLTRSIRAKNED